MPSEAIVAVALVALVVDLPLLIWWRERQRVRQAEAVRAAHGRAANLAQRAIAAYKNAERQGTGLRRHDLWVLALMAATGEGERESQERLGRATREAKQATLQTLLVAAAMRQERDMALGAGPQGVADSIAAAKQAVSGLVARDIRVRAVANDESELTPDASDGALPPVPESSASSGTI